MKLLKRLVYGLIALIVFAGIGGCVADYMLKSADGLNMERIDNSKQYSDDKFNNDTKIREAGFSALPAMVMQQINGKIEPSSPVRPIPVLPIKKADLLNLPKGETIFYKLGHSTILLWLDDAFWLIDPMFSDRASPFDFIGPKRFHDTPIKIADLPPIKGVILSHNHYDHLDKKSIIELRDMTEAFYMPLGLSGDLAKWGVDKSKIKEFDWHESIKVGNVSLTATPSQHFSGRAISDRNATLWASWVIKSPRANIFFSGDSGYFKGFKQIGQQYGPFDVSFMENGAYNKLWPDVHMMPKETVHAYLDLRSRMLVPIHNSSFDLSVHAWFDPLEQVTKFSNEQGANLLVPKMGEKIILKTPPKFDPWWRELM